jgi:putative transposase
MRSREAISATMKTTAPLQPGHYYHIYNRGNNREDLFREERNYRYFLQLYTRHVLPIAITFAYCLLRNHFYFLVRIRETMQTSQVSKTCEVLPLIPRQISQHFSDFFNAYTKSIHKAYGRTGSLFEERFGRIEVTTDGYFTSLVFYIHFNPQKHGFVDDFRDWPWSSYLTLRAAGNTELDRAAVLNWFGDKTQFDEFHWGGVDEKTVAALIDEDLE